jgi:hypothetical protein
MAITSTSTLAEVFTTAVATKEWDPSADDIKAWKTLTGVASDKVTISMGLTGLDLTTFLEDCALATTNCKSAEYEKYNGWALGV